MSWFGNGSIFTSTERIERALYNVWISWYHEAEKWSWFFTFIELTSTEWNDRGRQKSSCRHVLLTVILVTIQRMPSSICWEQVCIEHNNTILSQMPGEKVVILCHDSVVSANIPAKECQNLINKLPDDYSKTGELVKSLTVVVGMIVVMTVNVDVEDGLTNDVVKHIDYRLEGTNRPIIIWVLFDDPRIGRSAREKYKMLYQTSIENGHLHLMYNEHL